MLFRTTGRERGHRQGPVWLWVPSGCGTRASESLSGGSHRAGRHAGRACAGAGSGAGGQMLFPSCDPKVQGGLGPKGQKPRPSVRWQHPAGPRGRGPGPGRAPGGAAAPSGCPPAAAPAAASPQSGSGGWLNPVSRTSSRPPHQTVVSVCGTSWSEGTGMEVKAVQQTTLARPARAPCPSNGSAAPFPAVKL